MQIFVGYIVAIGTITGLFGGYQALKIGLTALAAAMGLAHAGIDREQSREIILHLMTRSEKGGIYREFLTKVLSAFRRILRPKVLPPSAIPAADGGAESAAAARSARLHMRFVRALEFLSPDEAAAERTAAHPWGWPVLDLAMRIALFYPVVFLVLPWIVTGYPGKIGDIVLLPADAALIPRFALAGVLILAMIAPFAGGWFFRAPEQRGLRRVIGWGLIILAVGLALLFGRVFAAASPISAAVSFTAAFAVAVLFSWSVKFAGAVSLALTVAVAIAYAAAVPGGEFGAIAVGVIWVTAVGATLAFFVRRGIPAVGFVLLWLMLPVALAISASILPEQAWSARAPAYLLFLALLPLTNAAFDYLSYGMTLFLMQYGINRGTPWPLLLGALDLLLSVLFFLALGMALVAVISVMNRGTGWVFLDLDQVFADLRAGEPGHLWLYAMIFTAFLPTFLHFSVSLASLFSSPQWLRGYVVRRLDAMSKDSFKEIGVIGLLGTVFLLALAIPAALWAVVGWGIVKVAPLIGEALITVFERVAQALG